MNSAKGIKYSDYYVAFLDILGFKKLVMSKSQRDKIKILKYFQLVEKITKDLKQFKPKEDISTIIVSDSIILTVPKGTDTDTRRDHLRQLCIAIQKIQFGLAEQDIWLRGAVSSGEAYLSREKNQVVGPAYIDAYLLEEHLAKYPRVILDNKIIKDLNADTSKMLVDLINYPSKGTEYDVQGNNVLFNWTHLDGMVRSELKNDVPLFIDYLAFSLQNYKKLNQIVDNIEKNIYADNVIYEKFRWVTDYLIDIISHQKGYLGISQIDSIEKRLRCL
jgi:hypothetical protein